MSTSRKLSWSINRLTVNGPEKVRGASDADMELSADAHVRRAGSLEVGEGAVVLPPSEEN